MKTLLYGGTFDPPHAGHLHNLRTAALTVRPDRTVVMPAGIPPHKQASATPAALRLEMCRCFQTLSGERGGPCGKLLVSGWEIAQAEAGKRNYTVLTLEKLTAEDPEGELYLTVGSDMLLTFREWFRWEDILRMARLVCVSREDGDAASLTEAAASVDPSGNRVLIVPCTPLKMSSTELRARLNAGEDCSDMLLGETMSVIRREGLYGFLRTEE